MKTAAIIQARMSSTRLPGKILTDVAGKPMLWHVVQRVTRAETLDQVIVATSDKIADNAVEAYCSQAGILCFRGSEGDVLDRYYQTARSIGAEPVVRITADCPLIDPEVIDKVVAMFQTENYDYVSNIFPRTYPEGLDTEVFSFAALERTWLEAVDPYDREHVTPYLRSHPELFRIGNVENPVDHSGHRWTVDHPEDMRFVQAVYAKMPQRPFGLVQVLQLLERYPELTKINTDITRRNSGRPGH